MGWFVNVLNAIKFHGMITGRKHLLLVALFGLLANESISQNTAVLTGNISNENGDPVPFANILIDSVNMGGVADAHGFYMVQKIPFGRHSIKVTAMGYREGNTAMNILNNTAQMDFVLKEDVQKLQEVVVEGKSEAIEKKEGAYAVEVIETKGIQNRDVNVNQLATQMAGIRVRESGGLGSSFSYSLNGMSGRSVRFFVDGIPMDRYGSGYAINNFPVNLISRVDIYKGVVPPQFGSDALGGIINIVTQNKYHSYLDASYSYGSFNTHRAALSTRVINKNTNMFVDVQGFYNYSDNNYEVWGPGVEVADPVTGRAIEVRVKRFHDTYKSASGKIDIGILDKKWVDELKVGVLYAGNAKELQHGATMASVIGEATTSETSYSTALTYVKQDMLTKGLDTRIFSSFSRLKTHITDTSSRIYNWYGQVIDERPTNSELGAGRNGKSLLTLTTDNQFHQANAAYTLSARHRVNLNYAYDASVRQGEDPMVSNRTASFAQPQDLAKQIFSAAYELNLLEELLMNTFWVKNYDFNVSTVFEQYITDSLGYRPIALPIQRHTNNTGYGYALKFNVRNNNILKLSLEKSYRLPGADEILGDGLFVRTNPYLKPEESLNFNIGWLASRILIDEFSRISIEPSFFYRNTRNLILYQVQQNSGAGQFINIGKVKGVGGSLDVKYEHKDRLQLSGNVTYQSLRDWNEYDGANKNQTYQDQVPNTPYFMANSGVNYNIPNILMGNDSFSIFWDLQYVHSFFLNWPSLGNPDTKALIPIQFINGTGISYSAYSGKYNLSFACQNIFNEQVYDNYLLQKPGRSFSVKLRVHLIN